MSLAIALKTEVIEPSQRRRELVSKITNTLDDMPELMRRVFVLNHYEGRSPIHISNQTGLSEADVDALLSADQRLHRVLRPLREA